MVRIPYDSSDNGGGGGYIGGSGKRSGVGGKETYLSQRIARLNGLNMI